MGGLFFLLMRGLKIIDDIFKRIINWRAGNEYISRKDCRFINK